MKKMVMTMIGSAILLIGLHASAQEDLVEHVIKSCETEIKSYCSTVTPGEGRLLHCAAAHEDKLSGKCEYALYQAASVLEQFVVAMSYLIDSCADDAGKYCSAVAAGDGRLLTCLGEHAEEISSTCKNAMGDTVEE